jgi:DNA-binding CsgD family transcriptional regulator
MLLERPERDPIVESFRAGAIGVVCRAEPIEALWKCLESVHRGKIWAKDDELKFVLEELASSPAVRALVHGDACALNERERNIVRLVAEGLTNRQIAAELGLNEHTLKSCLQNLFAKLGVSSRAEMVFAASVRAVAEASDPLALEVRGDCRSNDRARYDSYSRAAAHALPFAQLAVGKMCLEGRGTSRDLVAAYAWFLLAEDSARQVVRSSKDHRESLAASMSEEEIAAAEHRASELGKEPPLGSLTTARKVRNSQSGCTVEKDLGVHRKHALIA